MGLNVGLFEDRGWQNLLPLTWLRATFELRCGTDRLIDKVREQVGPVTRHWVRDLVRDVVRERSECAPEAAGADWCILNGRVLVTERITPPAPGVSWQQNGHVVGFGATAQDVAELRGETLQDDEALAMWLGARDYRVQPPPGGVKLLQYPWEAVLETEAELRRQVRDGTKEGQIDPGVHLLNADAISVAAGARVKPGVVLDAEDGPIRIDRDAEIQPNAVIVGPAYIGPKSVVRPTAVIREGTSIGPVCKVGGEIEASIFHGYANKQHDGFLGHSYVGEWVNLGADTVTSDLKNTYGAIRVYLNGRGVESGQHFIGSLIGDHAKTGIGTILPTGCVLGVASNVFTQDGVPRFLPSFAWLTSAELTAYRLDKAIRIARTVMARRDVELSAAEERLLSEVAQFARDVEAAGWRSPGS